MNVLKFIIANNILRLRTDAGMSRAELGDKIHYSEDYILTWERAEDMPDGDAIEALAKAFGVTADYITNPHDEWVSKEQREYIENTAGLAPALETKNLRARAEEEPKEEEKTPEKPKKFWKTVLLTFAFIVAAVALIYVSAEEGLIACHSQSAPPDDDGHEHTFGRWMLVTSETPYSDGESRNYCYGCEEYSEVRVLPASTPGLMLQNNDDGTCIVVGVGHGPETPTDAFETIVIPPYIATTDIDGNPLDMPVVGIGAGFLGSFGSELQKNVKNIVIPDTVKEIGAYAFYGTGIEKVSFPKGLTSIGEYAFAHCESIAEIELPESLEHLGEGVFKGCTALKKMSCLGNSVTEIPQYICQNCTSLESAYFGTAEAIGAGAFENCVNLRNFDADGIEAIEEKAFYGCSAIPTFTFKKEVNYIGDSAFEGCTGIEEIYMAQDGEKIMLCNSAFKGCTMLSRIDHAERFSSIGDHAFADCTALENIFVSAEQIGIGAFANCANMSAAVLGDGVIAIGDGAFGYCSGLTEVSFPSSVKTVGEEAFGYCENIVKFETFGALEKINARAFEGCDKLATLVLYSMAGEGFDEVFRGNENIIDVEIKSGEIPARAFENCTSLFHVELSEGVTAIGEYAFAGARNDDAHNPIGINFPESLKHIGSYAFSGAEILELTLGGNIEYVGDYAFSESSVSKVTIERDVETWGKYVFASCANLSDITVAEGVTKIPEGMFSGCESYYFTSVTLPESVTVIGANAFEKCNWLKTVNLSNGITEIGEEAFCYCQHMEIINFGGTKAEWEAVQKGIMWKYYIALDLTVYCSDGEIVYPGTLSQA